MKTSQTCPEWLLGSTLRSAPYQTASAKPCPALIHGKTFTIDGAALTWTAGDHFVQPDLQLAALTKTCRSAGGVVLPDPPTAHTANRLRSLSIESALNRVSGLSGRPLATVIRLPLSPHALVAG